MKMSPRFALIRSRTWRPWWMTWKCKSTRGKEKIPQPLWRCFFLNLSFEQGVIYLAFSWLVTRGRSFGRMVWLKRQKEALPLVSSGNCSRKKKWQNLLKVDDNQIKETYPFKNNTAFYFTETLTEVRPDRVFSEVIRDQRWATISKILWTQIRSRPQRMATWNYLQSALLGLTMICKLLIEIHTDEMQLFWRCPTERGKVKRCI